MFDSSTPYSPPEMPADFSSFAKYDAMGSIRSILLSIVPSTPIEECIRRLAMSSHLIFMERAYAGIFKIGSNDLIPIFNNVLKGNGTEYLGLLESLIKELKDMNLEIDSVDIIANRVKTLFSLRMAIKARALIEARFNNNGRSVS
ncbi:MAG: hypothetical protein ACUVQ5_04810 [Candidatus Methanomethylicaceae archaeon]